MNLKTWLPIALLAALLMSCGHGEKYNLAEIDTEAVPAKEAPAGQYNKPEANGAIVMRNQNAGWMAGSADSVVMFANATLDENVSYFSAPKSDKTAVTKQTAPQNVPIKKLIKTGTLKMKVKAYRESRKKLSELVPKFSGYIGAENETNDGSKITGTITIRVPFARFDELLESVSREGEYISEKIVNVDDVTAEYVDLSARLKTKLEVEERYRDILKKAVKIPDILEVENELRVIREEIEAAQGRMKYINDQAQLSTLSVEMYELLAYSAPPQAGFFSNIAEAFVNGWNGLLAFFVGLARIWPFLIFLSVAAFFGVRFLRKKAV